MKRLPYKYDNLIPGLLNLPPTQTVRLLDMLILLITAATVSIHIVITALNQDITITTILSLAIATITGTFALSIGHNLLKECKEQLSWTRTMRKTAVKNKRTNALYSEQKDTTFRGGYYFLGNGTAERNQNISILNKYRYPLLTERLGLTAKEIAGMDEPFFQDMLNQLELRAN